MLPPSPFPKVLIDNPRWCRYFLTDDGRKIPTRVDNGRAAFASGTSRSDSWSSYAAAYRPNPFARSAPVRLGFDIAAPFFAVDLDKVLDSGRLTSRGKELIAKLPETYAELSPSGRGLHLWYRVKNGHDSLPNATFVPSFEAYSRLRWFTMTGSVYWKKPVRSMTLKAALAVFAIGAAKTAPTRNKIASNDKPGLWSVEMMDSFLAACIYPYRKYGAAEFRVSCPGARPSSWSDGTNHDDDDLRGNATTVAVKNGYPVFYCHHTKCAGKRWRDFYDFIDPRHTWTPERWIYARASEIAKEFRRVRR
jgi:hypothetical protein